MIALKNILVATDFSEPSDAALAYGRELARTFGATLHVLHVVDNCRRASYGAEGYVAVDAGAAAGDRRRPPASSWTTLLIDEDRAAAAGPARSSSPSNAPAAAIVDYAQRREQIDLIVMGTHGRGAVATC